MAAKFLLVGLTTDGPNNQVFKPSSAQELRSLFGGLHKQQITLTPAASSVPLHFEPIQVPLNLVNNKPQRLYNPYVQNGLLYFGNIGGSANSTLVLEYEPNLGKADLLIAANRFADLTGSYPYVCRAGGVTSTLNVSGWYFSARYPGAKYNLVTVAFSPSSITIGGLEPSYTTKTYGAQGLYGLEVLQREMERDFRLGILPVKLERTGNLDSSGTFNLSGGSNGILTDQVIKDFLEYTHIPAEVSHVVFLRAVNNEVVNAIAVELSRNDIQPRMFMFNSPPWFAPATSWATSMANTVDQRHDQVACVLGDIEVNYRGQQLSRYAVEGAAIALASSTNNNATNASVAAISFSPELNKTELEGIKGFGWIPLMRYIRNDIALYQGVTSSNTNKFLFNSKLAEICSIANTYCQQFLGTLQSPGPKPELAAQLENLLRVSVVFLTLQKVSIDVLNDSMLVEIVGDLAGEILDISFVVRNA